MTREECEDRLKRPFHYCSWKGCNTSLAASIERFSEIRTARLAKKPSWNPASSLATIIDTGWSQYVRALHIPFFEDQLERLLRIDVRTSSSSKKELRAAELGLNQLGKAIAARGLQVLAVITAEMIGNDRSRNGLDDEMNSPSEFEWQRPQKELLASLDSIIAVLGLCRRFLPDPALQRRAEGKLVALDYKQRLVRSEWFGDLDRDLLKRYETEMEFDTDESNSPLCGFALDPGAGLCNRLTEIEAYRQGYTLDDGPWKMLRRLSTVRCTVHRSILLVPPSWGMSQIDLEKPSGNDPQESFTAGASTHGKRCEIAAVRHRQTCRLCPRRSELWAALRWGEEFNTYLSSDFCRHHRPQQQDGTWRRSRRPDLDRSTYESRVAKGWIYRREFSRLNAHVQFGERKLRTASNPTIDLFARNVIARSHLHVDENFELARIAWHLVEHHVTDRKKEIVMRTASQHSQAAIAMDLGMSRQAVHAALKSVPTCFRFDGSLETQTKQFITH